MSLSKSTPDTFTVVSTVPGGPAEAAGLKKGDVISTIDGITAKQLSGRDVLRRMVRPDGTKIAIAYTRNGKQAETTLVLKTLLP